MAAPLAGLRVVDCSAIIAGPVATTFLATYGADVLKVEPLEGDALRGYPSTLPGLSRYFLGINRGKRSLAVDLKHPDGRAIAQRLAARADVFVESFRPGVAARLGLDAPRLRGDNPRLVYCSISAFGQAGPLAERPGLDPVIQCYGGLAWEQGAATGAPPELVRGSLVDYYTGSLAAAGILLALLARERTGTGQRLETSLLDGVLAMQAGRAFWAQGREPPEAVQDLLGDRVSRIYPTRDGHLYLYVELPKFWAGLCRTLGCDGWLEDPRFRTMRGRHAHKAELIAAITACLAERTAAEWEARFTAAGVPSTRLRSIPELLQDAQALAIGALATVPHDALGPVRLLGVPVRLEATPGVPAAAPPDVGEHTDAVLDEIGLEPGEVARLRQAGVVR
ncbi:MAG TPA: CoA transferase [Methylomirabilota bacterium]|jgi:crotonobetainyl-CoA:carnitine CoA-transferase CaiB-like acyl-CoA transferase|nr:CoA transferase [Methylomirabilota bacterium]